VDSRPWRVGRKVGRTLYAQTGDDANDTDTLIGVMDTRELAERVVAAVNRRLPDVALARARAEAFDEAICAAEREASLYRQSSRRCDASGNTTGGSMDAAGALACALVAKRLAALKGGGQ
jgi:hypothetical protein